MTDDRALRSGQIDAAIADYLEAVERGAPLDRDEFLARHAGLAEELRQFLNDYSVLQHDIPKFDGTSIHDTPPIAADRTQRVDGTPADLSAGRRRFGQYELLEEVARGGMGVVYKARQATPNRIVALKMILAGQFASPADVQRFYAEAHAAAALDHPQIVPIFEVGEHEGQHYFTMAFVEGQSLSQRLASGPLLAKEAATIVRQAALAIEYAHQHGVVHRDLKPANILLDTAGRVRVTDFGLAKRQADNTGITRTGELLGTPSFMSPEQVSGDPTKIGAATDIYSLGATLYTLLTGRPPLQAASTVDTLRQVMDQEPVPLRQLDPSIPRDLETITLKCLAKDAARRYPTAREFADDLGRFLSNRPIVARRASLAERLARAFRRNPLVWTLAISVVVLLVAAVAILTISNARIRQESEARAAAIVDKDAALKDKDVAIEGRDKAITLAQEKESLARSRYYAAQMNLAAQAWNDGQQARTVELLETLRPHAGEPDPRGFEWYYQYHLSHPNLVRTWRAQRRQVNGIAWFPDGALFATCSTENAVRLWKGQTGEHLGDLILPDEQWVWCIAISPDGGKLATAGDNKTAESGEITVWDLAARTLLWRKLDAAHVQDGLRTLAFSPDSKIIATVEPLSTSDHSAIKLWNAQDGDLSNTTHEPEFSIGSLAFSPNGKTLVAASPPYGYPMGVSLWDVDFPSLTRRSVLNRTGATSLDFCDDGQTILLSGRNDLQLFDVSTETRRQTLPGGSGWINQIRVVPGKRAVVSASRDRTLRLWDLETGKSSPLGAELDEINSLAVDPLGRFVACGDNGGRVSLRRLGTPSEEEPLRVAKDVRAVAYTPDSQSLIVAGRPSSVIETGTLHGEQVAKSGFAISADGQWLVNRDSIRRASIWNIATNEKASTTTIPGDVQIISISPGGQWMAALKARDNDPAVDLYDARTGELVEEKKLDTVCVRSQTFSPDGRYLAVGLQFREVAVCDLETKTWAVYGYNKTLVWAATLAYSPDGKLLAAGLTDGTIVIFDVDPQSGALAERCHLEGHTLVINAMAFSPDGRTLASASDDQSVRFWDVPTAQERFTLNMPAKRLAFSPDGSHLAIVEADDAIRILDGTQNTIAIP